MQEFIIISVSTAVVFISTVFDSGSPHTHTIYCIKYVQGSSLMSRCLQFMSVFWLSLLYYCRLILSMNRLWRRRRRTLNRGIRSADTVLCYAASYRYFWLVINVEKYSYRQGVETRLGRCNSCCWDRQWWQYVAQCITDAGWLIYWLSEGLKGKTRQKWPIVCNGLIELAYFLENFLQFTSLKNFHSKMKFEANSDVIMLSV